jgi:glycerophosphoryl diester phosphodiesterase
MPRPALPHAFVNHPLAHRGFHDHALRRPENSLSAFAAAIHAGYGIELDVQRSADDQAMVFHDDTLDRMTDATGAVFAQDAARLGKIRLKNSDDFIPGLADVLALIAGRVPVLIEIKENLDTMLPTSGALEAAVADALRDYAGPVAVMSFNPHCMFQMARLSPMVPRGLTTEDYDPDHNKPIPPEVCARLRGIPDFDATGSSFISHKASDLGRPRVGELAAGGANILCWTIRSPAQEATARKIAQNITFEGYAAVVPA